LLSSETSNTAAITTINEYYPLGDLKKYCLPWSDLIEDIEVFRKKLLYCAQNILPDLVYGKPERLFLLSEEIEQHVLSIKTLVENLKNTKRGTTRYNNLSASIIALFNGANILLAETRKIVEGSGYKAKTDKYDFTDITKRDIGLD